MNYRDPVGVVHVRSRFEKTITVLRAENRMTLCEDIAYTMHWKGEQLEPTSETPTCVWCVAEQDA